MKAGPGQTSGCAGQAARANGGRRAALHHLGLRLELDGLPAVVVQALEQYVEPLAPASPSAAPPQIELLARVTDEVERPGGQPSFYHGVLRAFTRCGETLLWDGHSLVRVRRDGGRITAQIHPRSLQQPQLLVHLLLFAALTVALRNFELFHLHAAGVLSPAGQAALVVGEGGSGKSSVTLALASCGWRFTGDDSVWLTLAAEGTVALAVRRPFHVAPATARAFPRLRPLLGPPLGQTDKRTLPAELAFPGQSCRELRPQLLLFPQIIGQPPCRVTPLSELAAFDGLLRASALLMADGMPRRRAQHRVLQALLGDTQHLALELGADLFERPERLQQALASHGAPPLSCGGQPGCGARRRA